MYRASYNIPSFNLGNPDGTKIIQLSSMVRNVMRKFKVSFKEHDWVKKCCVHIKNIASYKKVYWRSPLEGSEGFTQDISIYRFHIWEPIC